MPWCRGGGPKPKRTQNRVKARSRGGQAHPLAVCSPDPHLLGPPGRKLRGDRLQACPQPPTPGHQLLMGSAERPPQGGCLSDRLPQTHEGAQVQAEEARSRPWPQEDRSPLWAWDQRATPPHPPSCPGTSPGLQAGTRGAHAILKHQRRGTRAPHTHRRGARRATWMCYPSGAARDECPGGLRGRRTSARSLPAMGHRSP